MPPIVKKEALEVFFKMKIEVGFLPAISCMCFMI